MQFGVGLEDQTPFGRFILAFQAVHAPDEVVRLDADILPMLVRECGINFRETGRFE